MQFQIFFATIALLTYSRTAVAVKAICEPHLLAGILDSSRPMPYDQIGARELSEVTKGALQIFTVEAKRILADESAPTFANTAVAFDSLVAKLSTASRLSTDIYDGLLPASPQITESVQLSGVGALRILNSFYFSKRFIARLRNVRTQLARKHDLFSAEDHRLMELLWEDFRGRGAFLNPQAKVELATLQGEMTELERLYGLRLRKAQSAVRIKAQDERQLDGLPQTLKDSARQRAANEGDPHGWSFALEGSTYLDVMGLARNRELRQSMFERGRRTTPNTGIYFAETSLLSSEGDEGSFALIRPLIAKRQRVAELLGFANYADYKLSTLSVGNAAAAVSVMRKLADAALPVAKREWTELQNLAHHDDVEKLEAWDVFYYAQKLRAQKIGVLGNQIAPFFELETLLPNTLDALGEIFGMTFHLDPTLPVFDSTVRAYRVRDTKTQVPLGELYLDLHGRAGKPNGFAATLRKRTVDGQTIWPASVVVNANFPAATPGTPIFLSFEDLRTLLHELGHSIHALSSSTKFARLAAPGAVEFDFVEFPSKFFENWIYDSAFMKRVARHYRTHAPLPPEILAKFSELQTLNSGLLYLAKAAYSLLDLAWHTAPTPDTHANIFSFEQLNIGQYLLHTVQPGTSLSGTFSHIFWGDEYAGLFSSYLLSEFSAVDGFEVFREAPDGTLSPLVGHKLRSTVFAPGGSFPSPILYQNFRGAQPALAPFLKKVGI